MFFRSLLDGKGGRGCFLPALNDRAFTPKTRRNGQFEYANDIVLVGSPGSGTTHADHVGLPAENVHTTTADNDRIIADQAGTN